MSTIDTTITGATRQDTWHITVAIPGITFGPGLGETWDQQEGGDVDSDELTYKPGGMADPVSLGGSRNVQNLTLRRIYLLGRDHRNSQKLIDAAGKALVTVTKQPLDHDGNVFGQPIVYRGKLKRVAFPTHDSRGNDAALLEIEVTVDGIPTGM